MITNKRTTVLILALIALLIPGPVLASDYTGQVQRLGVQGFAGPPTRVTAFTTNQTDCPVGGAYAFQATPDTSGLTQLLAQELTTAFTQGRNVVIHGTGICDAFLVEGILSVDLLP